LLLRSAEAKLLFYRFVQLCWTLLFLSLSSSPCILLRVLCRTLGETHEAGLLKHLGSFIRTRASLVNLSLFFHFLLSTFPYSIFIFILMFSNLSVFQALKVN